MKLTIKHRGDLRAYEIKVDKAEPINITEKLLSNLKPGGAVSVDLAEEADALNSEYPRMRARP